MTPSVPPISVSKGMLALSRWDALAILLILGLLVFLADTSRGLLQPLASLQASPLSLDPSHLPGYAARTTLAHAGGPGPFAALHLHLCHPRGEEQTSRAAAPAAARHSSVGPDPRLHLGDRRLLHVAGAGPRSRGGVRGGLRHLHEPGVEHGVQLLPVAAHGPDRATRSIAHLPVFAMDALLARRGALRDAAAHLEHDDVDVGRLVLRRRLGGDHCRRHHGHATRRRLLHRPGHRAAGPRRGRLGDRQPCSWSS